MQNFDLNFYEYIGSLLQQRNLKDFRFVATQQKIKFVASNKNGSYAFEIDIWDHDEVEYFVGFKSCLNEEDLENWICIDSLHPKLDDYLKEDQVIDYDKLVDWFVYEIERCHG